MTARRVFAALTWMAMIWLLGCGSVGYQTASGGPDGSAVGSSGNVGGFTDGTTSSAEQPAPDVPEAEIGPHSILVGDMNLNGVADAADVLILRRIAAGLEEPPPNRYPDVTGDGEVGEADVAMVEKAVTGQERWPIRSIGSALALDIAPELGGIRDGYSPEPVEIPADRRFTVDLWALEMTQFDGCTIRVDLGTQPGIRIDDIREGPFMTSAGAQVQFDAEIDGDGATITCRIPSAEDMTLPRGEGVIAHIDLTPIAPGSETTITLTPMGGNGAGEADGSHLTMHGALVRVASE